MRDVGVLRHAARRAYEHGRLRAALRVAAVTVPVTVLCAWETGALTRTLTLGVGLSAVAVLVRWRLRDGFATVATGLACGAVPLAAALALCRFAPSLPPVQAFAFCGSAGLLGGALFGRSLAATANVPWQRWSAAALVASLMATLGCIALGIGSTVGAAIGITVGTSVFLATWADTTSSR